MEMTSPTSQLGVIPSRVALVAGKPSIMALKTCGAVSVTISSRPSLSGKAPGYWLNYHRVVYAKKCLADMNMSALQIARSLNFAGLPQFCKFFKKQTGSTPSEFRKTLSWLK